MGLVNSFVFVFPLARHCKNFKKVSMFTDYTKTPKHILTDLFVAQTGHEVAAEDITFEPPVRQAEGSERNTITTASAAQFPNTVTLSYDRVALSTVPGWRSKEFLKRDATLISNLLPQINARYEINLIPEDIVDGPLPTDLPGQFTVAASNTSLVFDLDVALDIREAKPTDIDFTLRFIPSTENAVIYGSASSDDSWDSGAFGNGVFLISCYRSGSRAISKDGQIWELQPRLIEDGAIVYFETVRFENAQFVATRNGSPYTSLDGKVWTKHFENSPHFYINRAVFLEDGKIIEPYYYGLKIHQNILDYGTYQAMVDADGAPMFESQGSVADLVRASDGMFLAISTAHGFFISTDNCETWIRANTPYGGAWQRCAHGNGVFVAVSGSGAESRSRIAYSVNGIDWTQADFEPTLAEGVQYYLGFNSVVFAGNIFYAFTDNHFAFVSENGIDWKTLTTPKMAWGGTFAVHGNGTWVIGLVAEVGASVVKEFQINDSFETAVEVTVEGPGGTITGRTSYAGKESGEPDFILDSDGTVSAAKRSIWYKFTPDESGVFGFSTNGSRQVDRPQRAFDAVIGIYSGTALNNLVSLATSASVGLEPRRYATATVTLVGGQTYYIRIDQNHPENDTADKTGHVVLSWTRDPVPVAAGPYGLVWIDPNDPEDGATPNRSPRIAVTGLVNLEDTFRLELSWEPGYDGQGIGEPTLYRVSDTDPRLWQIHVKSGTGGGLASGVGVVRLIVNGAPIEDVSLVIVVRDLDQYGNLYGTPEFNSYPGGNEPIGTYSSMSEAFPP